MLSAKAIKKTAQKARVVLPPNFEPTPEEQSLLDLYKTVKQYEKEAAKLKEKGARERLRLADEQFKIKQQQEEKESAEREENGGGEDVYGGGAAAESNKMPKKKRSKKKKTKEDVDPMDDASDASGNESDSHHSDSDSAASNDDYASFMDKPSSISPFNPIEPPSRQPKQPSRSAAQVEEEKRREMMGQEEDVDDLLHAPLVTRKNPKDLYDDEGPSLIANIGAAKTPPHDFSKSLGMGKANLSGKVLFPETLDNTGRIESWAPPEFADGPTDGALELELPDFHAQKASSGSGNNTLAIKFSVPKESRRFSFNIAGPNHGDYNNVLFHFNPRQRQKGGHLVINDKQEGTWGQGINVPLSQIPVIFGQISCTLILQITGDCFDVFIGDKHCARLDHRTSLPRENCSLHFQVPSTDDYGSLENWIVYRVWWGRKDLKAGDLEGVAGVNQYSSVHPKKLFISGLTKIKHEAQVDLRRAELERAFRKYGGALGCKVTVPTNSTFAFVEVETERQADIALQEMAHRYRLNRARRSKHEALQEERAAAEAKANAGGGSSTVGRKRRAEGSEWD
uniref:Galectin n=1 Tax=Ditylum brightwellii TaxID=49249 RepID=A0A7S4RBW9_9STRA